MPCTSLLLKRQLLDAVLALLHSETFDVHVAAARLLTRLVRGVAHERVASCDAALATNVDDDEVLSTSHTASRKPAASRQDVDGTHCTVVEAFEKQLEF